MIRPATSAKRGVAAIMGGTALGQVGAVAASPLLARLFTPADFGFFSVVSALAIILGTVVVLRYEMAIVLPENDDDARALVFGGFALVALISSAMAVPLWFARTSIAEATGVPDLDPWILLVPATAAAFGCFRLLNQWALRAGRYLATARRNIVQSLVTVVAQIAAGISGLRGPGLIGGLALGQWVGAGSLIVGSGLFSRSWRGRVRHVLRRYRRFALTLAPAGLINAAGVYSPLVIVAIAYGPVAAGLFGFTQRILTLPVTLIGQSAAQVYLSEMARRRRDGAGDQARLFRLASKRLAVPALVGAAVLLAAGEPLFVLVFGEVWRGAGQMAQALSFALAGQLIASPLSQTLIAFERTGLQLLWDIGRFALVVGALLGAAAVGATVLEAIWVVSAASTAAYAISWFLSRHVVDVDAQLPRQQ